METEVKRVRSKKGLDKKKSILIVDDDEGIRRTLLLIFGKNGYQAETAATGREALKKARGRFFNAALVDIRLPDGDGMELLASLKELHPDMMMIMITGHASAETVARALNDGASAYVTKPLDMDEVLDKVRESLEKQRLIEDKRQAEEALRESEGKYRSLFENMLDGFAYCKIIVDENDQPVDFVYLEVNDAFEKLTGLKRADVVGKRVTEAIPGTKEEHPELFDIYGKVALTGEEDRFDIHFGPLDIWLSISVYSPRKGYFVAVFDNITERKRAEETIQRKLQFERTISRISSRFVRVSDIDEAINTSLGDIGRLTGAGRAYVFLMREDGVTMDNTHEWCAEGASPEIDNLQNLPCDMFPWWMERLRRNEVIHIEDVSRLPKEADAEKEILESQNIKSVLVLPLNVERELAGFIGLDNVVENGELRDDDLTLLRIASETIGNASERKRVEQALRCSEEHFRSLIENASDGIVIVEVDGTIRYESPSFERLLGYYPEERIGGSVFQSVHPDDMPMVAEGFAEAMEKPGATLKVEVRLRHRDGSWHTFEAVGRNLCDDPAVRGIVANVRDITDRKQAEEALRESEERYRTLVENATDFIYLVDADNKILSLNQSAANLFGKEHGELIGKTLFDVFPKEIAAAFSQSIKKVFQTEKVRTSETKMIAGEKEMWISSSLSPVRDHEGKVVAVMGATRDFTERKRAEEERHLLLAVLERQNKGGGLKQMIRDALLLIKEFSGCEAVGIRLKEGEDFPYYETSGFPIEFVQAEGTLCARDLNGQLLRDENGNAVLECMCGNIACGRFDPQKPFFTRGGSFWTNSTTELLTSMSEEERQQGRIRRRCSREGYESVALIPLKVEGVNIGVLQLNNRARDYFTPQVIEYYESIGHTIGMMLARKQAEEALRESEEKLQRYLEMSPDAVYIYDGKGTFLYGNRAAEKMVGYSREELIGKSFLEVNLLSPEDLPEAVQNLERGIAGSPTGPDEYELIRKDGNHVFAEISTFPIGRGDETEVIGVARDVTERKRMERQLQLTGRLAAVGELAAGVAHELNNPLTAVQAYAQLLNERSDLDETAKSDVETIYREAQRASRITGNLLSFARQHTPEKNLISINETIRRSLELQAYRMKVDNIDIVMELDPDLPKTMADPYQMQQVFVNLVTNAEQAMTEAHGRGTLLIKTQKAGQMIRMTFTDDGPGILEENLKRVFDPFFTTKDVGKGTGLGLSICYGIVREHGGNMSAKSGPGEGATFVVEVPIVSEDQ